MHRYIVAVVIGAAAFIPDTVSATPPVDPVGEFVAWAESQGYSVQSAACVTADNGVITCYAIETSFDQLRIVSRVLNDGEVYRDVWVRDGLAPAVTGEPAFGNGHYTIDQMPPFGTYAYEDDGSDTGDGCVIHVFSDLAALHTMEFVSTLNEPGTYYIKIDARAKSMYVQDCADTWKLVP